MFYGPIGCCFVCTALFFVLFSVFCLCIKLNFFSQANNFSVISPKKDNQDAWVCVFKRRVLNFKHSPRKVKFPLERHVRRVFFKLNFNHYTAADIPE